MSDYPRLLKKFVILMSEWLCCVQSSASSLHPAFQYQATMALHPTAKYLSHLLAERLPEPRLRLPPLHLDSRPCAVFCQKILPPFSAPLAFAFVSQLTLLR